MSIEEIATTLAIQYGKALSEREIYWYLKDIGFNAPEDFAQDILDMVKNAIIRVRFI